MQGACVVRRRTLHQPAPAEERACVRHATDQRLVLSRHGGHATAGPAPHRPGTEVGADKPPRPHIRPEPPEPHRRSGRNVPRRRATVLRRCRRHGIAGLPDPKPLDGRGHWVYDDVAARLGDLLTISEIAEVFGYRSKSTIYQPGFFPDPDETPATAGDRRGRLRWKLLTVITWDLKRPGRGRHAGSRRTLPKLPDVSWERDPDALLSTPQVAALLGFSSVKSFSSSPSQGNLPDLRTPDGEVPGSRGPRKAWKRQTVRAVGQRLGLVPGEQAEGDELWSAEQAAPLFGYSSANSFTSALAHGRLPELEEPDALVPSAAGKGRRQKGWRRSRLEAAAAERRGV